MISCSDMPIAAYSTQGHYECSTLVPYKCEFPDKSDATYYALLFAFKSDLGIEKTRRPRFGNVIIKDSVSGKIYPVIVNDNYPGYDSNFHTPNRDCSTLGHPLIISWDIVYAK